VAVRRTISDIRAKLKPWTLGKSYQTPDQYEAGWRGRKYGTYIKGKPTIIDTGEGAWGGGYGDGDYFGGFETGGGIDYNALYEEARRSMEEAKRKQEESKAAALGYYEPIRARLGAMEPSLITPEQKARMEETRRTQLGAYGQSLAEIGMGIAGRQANLPIELELDIAARNRAAALELYSAQAGVAGGMAGIQTAYQYDPGLEYVQQLGYGLGYTGGGTPTTDVERLPKGGWKGGGWTGTRGGLSYFY
jgi:hypothetical protein